MNITVLIADDHKIVREALCSMLESAADLDVVALCSDGRAAVERAQLGDIDVVVMDVSMPGLNGIEATRQIGDLGLATKVVALSSHESSKYLEGMLRAGAAGYLSKTCDREELLRAIRSAARGDMYLSPSITGHVVSDYIARADVKGGRGAKPLTGREGEVLQMVAEGVSTAAIAERLSLSIKTIESHRKKIMDKLEIRTVAELTKYAIREGITDLGD